MKMFLLATALTLSAATVATVAPAAAETGNVPLCSKTVTDECMNPSEAAKGMHGHHHEHYHHHHHHHHAAYRHHHHRHHKHWRAHHKAGAKTAHAAPAKTPAK